MADDATTSAVSASVPEADTQVEGLQLAEQTKALIMNRISELSQQAADEKPAPTLEEERDAVDQLLAKAAPDERYETLRNLYVSLKISYNRVLPQIQRMQTKFQQLISQRDKATEELERANTARRTLEELCRGLQQQNKLIKEENDRVFSAAEEKRKQLSAQFQASLDDISEKIKADEAHKLKTVQQSEELQKKFEEAMQRYQLGEAHYQKQLKMRDLQVQLAEAKQAQAELSRNEQVTMVQELQTKLKEKEVTESSLKTQLASYAQKFEQFQETLTRSNNVFGSFKAEMEKKAKELKQREEENSRWRVRLEKTNVALASLKAEHEATLQENRAQQAKTEKLEQLCRALQQQRLELVQQVEGLKPQAPEESEESPAPSPAAAATED
ncbi:uncharacterized protein MONBRDRAFT_22116 [Monosiga brevicollis MX1]|uniref:Uncharacterized protein n=1 Tax=Monosiga brevicollis TaxID=81824 RepID=A9UPL8_MONBE|nr:uncharacterized protein MONBRDRAFT_22116 [Monosiga brevicollis MX1]EDQ92893.1 predicted protein [Monosiga brevicollis MX1]|eukprot:XP_001742655.1 hypothetical protein [Monosiga brevicollis MX1]